MVRESFEYRTFAEKLMIKYGLLISSQSLSRIHRRRECDAQFPLPLSSKLLFYTVRRNEPAT